MSTGEKDAAFDRVYAELFRDVFAYFNVCFGSVTAEDLAQEVFLRVWKAIDSGKTPDNWRAWEFPCEVILPRRTNCFGTGCGNRTRRHTAERSERTREPARRRP